MLLKTYEEMCAWCYDNYSDIVTRSDLKDAVINYIEEDNLPTAIHLLEALNNNSAEYFDYNMSMGSLETPQPINDQFDITSFMENHKKIF